MDKRYSCRFDQLKVGAKFNSNGNSCLKLSSRTAQMVEYGRTFHYGASEQVEITDLSGLNHDMADTGYLQHGKAPGPFKTESVRIKQDNWPNADKWLALYEGKWRRVFVQVGRTFIRHNGENITIQIEGV